MAYMIQAVTTAEEMLWHLQDRLRSAESGASWTYIDGRLAGSDNATSADWNSSTPATITGNDYIILQAPAMIALGGADAGVIQFRVNAAPDTVEFLSHTGGWDPDLGGGPPVPGPKAGSVELGAAGSVAMPETNVESMHIIANSRRVILVFRGSALAGFNIFYIGAIQTFYAEADDANAILVAGHAARVFGDNPEPPADMLMQDGSSGTYLFNSDVFPGANPAKNLLSDCQPNRRVLPVKRVGIPVVVGCDDAGNEEIRGELEGVFYYGAAGGLSADTAVVRDDGTYVVMHSGANSLVCGPVQ